MTQLRTIDFIIPVYNEEESLRELFLKIDATMKTFPHGGYTVYFINDGSKDSSWKIISDLSHEFGNKITGINLRRNKGKAFALNIGFKHSTADLIFTMDADLQDEPSEIPNFIKEIDNGSDLVSGWKQIRNDPIDKTFPSKVFNKLVSSATGIKLHDFNCGFKCYRSEVAKNLQLYGELHRFTPVLASFYGFKISEIPVEHKPRSYGKSKYGFERFIRGFIDLISVVLFTRFSDRPAHLFGGVGILFGLIGGLSIAYLVALKLITGALIGSRPLLSLGILLSILSVQLISIGLIAELILRKSKFVSREELFISEKINLE